MLIPFTECIKASGGQPFRGVLHIGAHLGEEGLDYSQNGVRHVSWVEGNRHLMKHLYDATRSLPLRQSYFCELLSDVDGEHVQFNVTNNGQSSSILPLGTHQKHYPHINVVEQRDLVTSRFDTFLKKNIVSVELENVDFVNLDVQGAELRVLKGFGLLFDHYKNIKAVYCEVNFEEVYVGANLVADIDEYLGKFGFTRLLTKTTPYGWGDALYLRK